MLLASRWHSSQDTADLSPELWYLVGICAAAVLRGIINNEPSNLFLITDHFVLGK